MANANDFDVLFAATKEFTDSFGLGLDGTRWSLLDEDIAILTMFKSKQDKIHGLIKTHNEACHSRFCQSDWLAIADLVNPEGNDRAPAAHYVAIACAADLGGARLAGLGYSHLLFDRLGDAHSVDGVSSFISAKADDCLDFCFDRSGEDVVRSNDIGADGLHREELTARDLFECCSVENIIYSGHRAAAGLKASNIADVELDLMRNIRILRLILVAHVILFLLVTRKDTDLSDVRAEEPLENCIAEGTSASGNH